MSQRPQAEEYAEYHGSYIIQVEGDEVLEVLTRGLRDIMELLGNLPEEKWEYRYAPEKWTIKELVIHMIDTERIFAYRCLRIARNDQTPLIGFEQNGYVPYSNAAERSPQSIMEEYKTVRAATLSLFQHLRPEDLIRRGTTSGFPTSCRSTAFALAGHEVHHMKVLREKYLS